MNCASLDTDCLDIGSGLRTEKQRSFVPITVAGLNPLCMKWLFPGLMLALVIGPQPWARPFYFGQMFVLLNDLAAAIIVFTTFRARLWPLVLIFGIVFAKVISIVLPSAGTAYVLLADILIFLAGGIIALQQHRLVYRQLMALCTFCVVFMVMQVAGFGGVSQILSTDYVAFSRLPDIQTTLFTPLEDIVYDVKVFRPAGLLRTGTLVSLVALFAVPFHLSQTSGRFPGGTTAICAMVVLSMSKIGLVGFTVVTLFFFLKGTRNQRHESIKAILFAFCFIYLYAFFFPGLIAHNLGGVTIEYSVFVRVNDIIELLPKGNSVRNLIDPFLVGTTQAGYLKKGEHVSGIPMLLTYLPFVLPLLVVLTVIFYRSYRSMRFQYRRLTLMCVPILIGVGLYPAVFPIWETGLYWFMMSFALFPVLYFLFPGYFNNLTAQSEAMGMNPAIPSGFQAR